VVYGGAFGVPILLGGEVLGVLEFFCQRARPAEMDLIERWALSADNLASSSNAAERVRAPRKRSAQSRDLGDRARLHHHDRRPGQGNRLEPAAETNLWLQPGRGSRPADGRADRSSAPPRAAASRRRPLPRDRGIAAPRKADSTHGHTKARSRVPCRARDNRRPNREHSLFTAYVSDITDGSRPERTPNAACRGGTILAHPRLRKPRLRASCKLVVPTSQIGVPWTCWKRGKKDPSRRRRSQGPEKVAVAHELWQRYPPRKTIKWADESLRTASRLPPTVTDECS